MICTSSTSPTSPIRRGDRSSRSSACVARPTTDVDVGSFRLKEDDDIQVESGEELPLGSDFANLADVDLVS